MFHHCDINGFDLDSYFYRDGYVTQDCLHHCEESNICAGVLELINISCHLKAVNHNNKILKPNDSLNYFELHKGEKGT